MEYKLTFFVNNYVKIMSGKGRDQGYINLVVSEARHITTKLEYLFYLSKNNVHLIVRSNLKDCKSPSDFTAKVNLPNVSSVHYRMQGCYADFAIPKTVFEQHVVHTLNAQGCVRFSALSVFLPEVEKFSVGQQPPKKKLRSDNPFSRYTYATLTILDASEATAAASNDGQKKKMTIATEQHEIIDLTADDEVIVAMRKS
jgi:hypothetical protein